MVNSPFFSVVIPTKNRSHLVSFAIESVLWQSFEDFEIIVVDNDDTDATSMTLKSFNDSRIRHLRTGGLSMPDNWDIGFREAQGEYLVVLADKGAFIPNALSMIKDTIDISNHQIITWSRRTYNDVSREVGPVISHGQSQYIDTAEILSYLWDIRPKYYDKFWRFLPRGYNSATHKSVIQMIINKLGRVCNYVTPDYTFGFAQLALEEETYYIDQALYLVNKNHSNGRNFVNKKQLEDIWQALGGKDNFYDKVPVKSASLNSNLIFNDFLRMQESMQGNLSEFPFDVVIYFTILGQEISQRALKTNMSQERADWESALSQQPVEVRQAVRQNLNTKQSEPTYTIKSVIKSRLRALRRWLVPSKTPNWGDKGYYTSTILDAAKLDEI